MEQRSGIPEFPSRSGFLSTRNGSLHYLEWGSSFAPPLLLLHGGAAHAHWWDHVAPVLAPNHHVVALDLRGHGESSWIVPPAYEVDDYVADLEEVIAALQLAPLTLIGHSLGGFVALSYAIAHARHLVSLIVVDIGYRLGGNRYMRLLRHMPPPVYQDEADLFGRFRLLPAETRAAAALVQHVARHSVKHTAEEKLALKCDRATFTRRPQNLLSQLSCIPCPTLFLRGSDSKSLSISTLDEMVRCCPTAHSAEIPDAGHHVFLDNPLAFLTAVRNFLLLKGRTLHARPD